MSEQSGPPTPKWVKTLADSPWVEPILGALVAIFGIATAGAAYQASIYGGNSSENFFVAQSALTDTNFFYNQADQIAQKDFDILTEIEVQTALDAPDEAIDALVNALSEDALASFQRSNDLDDEYYDGLYKVAVEYEDTATKAFASAKDWDALGDDYELLGLILAVGLGFAGWAGLLGRESVVRYAFATMAVVALALSIYMTINLVSRPIPPMFTPPTSDTE
jgi:hypothetical protein